MGRDREEDRRDRTLFWRVRQGIFIVIGGFFLFFGIHLLLAAYRLKDPGYFVLTFFASNLMILISAVLLLGFILQLLKAFRKGE